MKIIRARCSGITVVCSTPQVKFVLQRVVIVCSTEGNSLFYRQVVVCSTKIIMVQFVPGGAQPIFYWGGPVVICSTKIINVQFVLQKYNRFSLFYCKIWDVEQT